MPASQLRRLGELELSEHDTLSQAVTRIEEAHKAGQDRAEAAQADMASRAARLGTEARLAIQGRSGGSAQEVARGSAEEAPKPRKLARYTSFPDNVPKKVLRVGGMDFKERQENLPDGPESFVEIMDMPVEFFNTIISPATKEGRERSCGFGTLGNPGPMGGEP